MSKTYIKCPKCGTANVNNDYCSNCGTILNIVLKRKLEREQKEHLKVEAQKLEEPSKMGEFLKRGEEHSNFFVRGFFKVSYALWYFFAVVIGGLIAAVIAAAAG